MCVSLIAIKDFYDFSGWLFEKFADFLLSLGDYIILSVIICVLVQMVIYAALIYSAYFKKKNVG